MRLNAKHIDAIAREKQRDVLFIHFEFEEENLDLDLESVREQVIKWLEQNQIPFQHCLGLEGDDHIVSDLGDLYLDVPYDEDNAQYQLIRNYLEDEDGEMKIEGVLFFVLSLDVAIEIGLDLKEQALEKKKIETSKPNRFS